MEELCRMGQTPMKIKEGRSEERQLEKEEQADEVDIYLISN